MGGMKCGPCLDRRPDDRATLAAPKTHPVFVLCPWVVLSKVWTDVRAVPAVLCYLLRVVELGAECQFERLTCSCCDDVLAAEVDVMLSSRRIVRDRAVNAGNRHAVCCFGDGPLVRLDRGSERPVHVADDVTEVLCWQRASHAGFAEVFCKALAWRHADLGDGGRLRGGGTVVLYLPVG